MLHVKLFYMEIFNISFPSIKIYIYTIKNKRKLIQQQKKEMYKNDSVFPVRNLKTLFYICNLFELLKFVSPLISPDRIHFYIGKCINSSRIFQSIFMEIQRNNDYCYICKCICEILKQLMC